MSSALVAPAADRPLTPGMLTVLWEVAALVDEARVPADTKDAVWLAVEASRLRGMLGRDDNVWLRICLERLLKTTISGTYRGEQWGAVILAEYHFHQGGSLVRLLVPPGAIRAMRAPATFAKIEVEAAHQMRPHARRLYALLADKKNLSQNWWVYELEELKALMGLTGKKAYVGWNNFQKHVLHPALDAINAFGTVTVKMTPQKLGRAVHRVRFDWQWKTLDQARETVEENERHSLARRREQAAADAPPIVETHFVETGTVQWSAWAEHGRQTRGVSGWPTRTLPDGRTGWDFPTEWPTQKS